MRKSLIRVKVQEVRDELHIGSIPVDIEDAAKCLGLSIVEKELDDSVSGALIAQKKIILVNSLHHEHRKRFTIAHEIGHFLLHSSLKQNIFIDESLTFYRSKKSSFGVYVDEVDANNFAAELLMPEDYIKEYLDQNKVDIFDSFSIENLAAKFNVSQQAVAVRLQSLGLISTL